MQFGEPASSLPSPEWVSELLLVDGAPETAAHAEALRRLCATVNVTAHQHTALQFLRRSNPTLVVIAGNLTDGSSIALCKEAKSKQRPPSVLVTPDRPEDVPDSLAAGCDGVLLKPFSSSLLVNRVSRLLRARAEDLRRRSARSSGKAQHLPNEAASCPLEPTARGRAAIARTVRTVASRASTTRVTAGRGTHAWNARRCGWRSARIYSIAAAMLER
jgi:DNA-binding NarL/FixJ family response regulator